MYSSFSTHLVRPIKAENPDNQVIIRVYSYPDPEPAVDMPGHERQVRAGKVTAPEEYKRRFLVPAPKSVEWKTAYIDGRLHRRIAMLVRAAGCGSISGFIIRLLELHMEEHREDIAALLGEVYRPWDEDGQPGEPARR